MGIFRDFLRRLLGKTPSLPHRPPEDEELRKRLDDLEHETLQRIGSERESDLQGSAPQRRKLPRPANVQQLGRLPETAADCSAAIDRGFRHAEVYLIRAIALDSVGRGEEAIADCSMALHLNPEHAGAYNSRGLIRGRLGRFDEALADFSEAIRLSPEWFLPRVHRAQVQHSCSQLDSALADYDRAIELMKQSTLEQAAAEEDPTLALIHCRRGDAR